MKLSFRRKGKQWLPIRYSSPLATPEVLACGHLFRTLNVVNDFNQEGCR
ncbi:hypothetical protein AGA01_004025 [Escherichia coli]|nr:hypothetical protein [Escherichia coli]